MPRRRRRRPGRLGPRRAAARQLEGRRDTSESRPGTAACQCQCQSLNDSDQKSDFSAGLAASGRLGAESQSRSCLTLSHAPGPGPARAANLTWVGWSAFHRRCAGPPVQRAGPGSGPREQSSIELSRLLVAPGPAATGTGPARGRHRAAQRLPCPRALQQPERPRRTPSGMVCGPPGCGRQLDSEVTVAQSERRVPVTVTRRRPGSVWLPSPAAGYCCSGRPAGPGLGLIRRSPGDCSLCSAAA